MRYQTIYDVKTSIKQKYANTLLPTNLIYRSMLTMMHQGICIKSLIFIYFTTTAYIKIKNIRGNNVTWIL